MSMTEEQKKEFEVLAMPLIDWLNDNMHPHAHIYIDTVSAEVSEGVLAFAVKTRG